LWPALAGVTLHRPWLSVSRAELRQYNKDEDLAFVDDPSNENRDFTRIRARQALAADQNLRADLLAQQAQALERLRVERHQQAEWLEKHTVISPHGYIQSDAIPSPELLLHLLNIVAGQGGPIDAAKRRRLCAAMEQSDFTGATLSGAWVKRQSHGFVYTRDMVAVRGRDGKREVTSMSIEPHKLTLWDGRFWIESKHEDVIVKPAFGALKNLRQYSETKAIFDLPSDVRPCLPAYTIDNDPIGFGAVEMNDFKAGSTAAQRLQALFEI